MATTTTERIGHIAFIRYKGGIKGEEPIDDRSSGEPLEIMLGARQLPHGVENALYDMEEGEQRLVEIEPRLGYGDYDDQRCNWYPRSVIANGYKLSIDSAVRWTDPNSGQRLTGFVTRATQDAVEIDFNHPLAGQTLEYWLELVSIK